MSRKAAQTGPGAMVLVAMEQYFPEAERIVTDNLALPILPFGYRAEVRLIGRLKDWVIRKSEEKVPGLWGGIMSRKRYIDGIVSEAANGQIEAVVNLGAGFDTRAFRLQALAEVPVWEVDQKQNNDAKRARLEKLFQEIPTHVTLVPIDFDHEDLATVLASHGYTPEKKTFFIWEGVTQYLTETGVRATFEFLGPTRRRAVGSPSPTPRGISSTERCSTARNISTRKCCSRINSGSSGLIPRASMTFSANTVGAFWSTSATRSLANDM